MRHSLRHAVTHSLLVALAGIAVAGPFATSPVAQQLLLYPPSGTSIRQPFSLPPGPQQFTLQFVSLQSAPLCGAQALAFAASPALLVAYP